MTQNKIGYEAIIKDQYNFKLELLNSGAWINLQQFTSIKSVYRTGIKFYFSISDSEINDIDRVRISSGSRILVDRKVASIIKNTIQGERVLCDLAFLDPGEGVIVPNKLFKNFEKTTLSSEEERKEIEDLIVALTCNTGDIEIQELKEEDREKLYRFRFREYAGLGKVDETIFPGGLLKDNFDNCSYILVAKVNGNLIGSVRCTLEKDVDLFEAEIDNNNTKVRDMGYSYGEISRFCISKYFRGVLVDITSLYTKLYGGIYAYCLRNKVDKLMLTALKGHRSLYKKFGFICTGTEIIMKHFRYSYFIMICELKNTSSIENDKINKYITDILNKYNKIQISIQQ